MKAAGMDKLAGAKILYSGLSPYAAKVRMAAGFVGYEFESVPVDAFSPTDSFLSSNPLGKIPVLITSDGRTIHDSRVIVQFLDQWSGGRLFPQDPERRLAVAMLESFADGIGDCLQAIMMERRFRPEDKRHVPWTDRLWAKVTRSLDRLEGEIGLEPETHVGHFALRAMLGYLALRFSGEWERDCPLLSVWADAFDRDHPELVKFAPQLPSD